MKWSRSQWTKSTGRPRRRGAAPMGPKPTRPWAPGRARKRVRALAAARGPAPRGGRGGRSDPGEGAEGRGPPGLGGGGGGNRQPGPASAAAAESWADDHRRPRFACGEDEVGGHAKAVVLEEADFFEAHRR